jgi:hypothetical protein
MDKIRHKIGVYFAQFFLEMYQGNPDRYVPFYQQYCRFYADEGIPIINGPTNNNRRPDLPQDSISPETSEQGRTPQGANAVPDCS